jgi:formate-dependent nitrite reductase membrane component NrfD
MESVFDDFFIVEDLNRYIKKIVKPIVSNIYNEFYIYIWFICLYNVFLIFLTLANLIILSKLTKKVFND